MDVCLDDVTEHWPSSVYTTAVNPETVNTCRWPAANTYNVLSAKALLSVSIYTTEIHLRGVRAYKKHLTWTWIKTWRLRTWTSHMQGRKAGLNRLLLENLPNWNSGVIQALQNEEPLLWTLEYEKIWICGWKLCRQNDIFTEEFRQNKKRKDKRRGPKNVSIKAIKRNIYLIA